MFYRTEDINAKIYEETGIAIDDQEIISSAGQEVSPKSSMFEYIAKDVSVVFWICFH